MKLIVKNSARISAHSIAFLFSLSFMTSVVFAKEGVLEVQPGEKVYYHSVITNKSKPTLVLLPGIYRGLNDDDEIIKILKRKKVNYVAIHFSGHPASILQLKENETAVFATGKGLTSEMLAHEVEAVVSELKIKTPIAVSLSYSSTVVAYLNPNIFPTVIETAPLGAFGEDDPLGTAQRKAWTDWLKLWPGNHFWLEAAQDKAYRDHWAPVAYERAEDYENIDSELLTAGYMAMARAIENYDLRLQDFSNQPRRIWIFAENENEYRRQIQDEAVQIYNDAAKSSTTPIVIADSGHIIPTEQPKAYAAALLKILSVSLK